MIKEGAYLINDDTAVVHILKLTESELVYEQGWYISSACSIAAGCSTEHIDLTDSSLPEPIFYYESWVKFFEETYEETDKETYNRVYNKAAEIAHELEMLKLKI